MKNRNFNDWVVAAIVIACSAVLFGALAIALSGAMLGKPSRTLRVNFPDVTGINPGARVKYAGAVAGSVAAIRMLSAEERSASGDPRNAVEVTLGLNRGVPGLPADVTVSIAADTLLSDKFILIAGGSPQGKPLSENAVVQGIAPTSFDKLARDADEVMESLRGMLGGSQGEIDSLLGSVRTLLTELRSVVSDAKVVIAEARPVVGEAGALMTDGRRLLADNREPITRTLAKLEAAGARLEAAGAEFEELAGSAKQLVADNQKNLTATLSDFRTTSENLKVTSTYAKILIQSLSKRPSQLIWGASKPPPLPSEQEILRTTRPLPAN